MLNENNMIYCSLETNFAIIVVTRKEGLHFAGCYINIVISYFFSTEFTI